MSATAKFVIYRITAPILFSEFRKLRVDVKDDVFGVIVYLQMDQSDEVEKLKKLILHNSYILTLPEVGDIKDDVIPKNVQQFWVRLVMPLTENHIIPTFFCFTILAKAALIEIREKTLRDTNVVQEPFDVPGIPEFEISIDLGDLPQYNAPEEANEDDDEWEFGNDSSEDSESYYCSSDED